MSEDAVVVAARAKALAARARLDSSLAVARQRLNPKSLAADAVGSAADKASLAAQTGIQAVRDRPAIAAAVAGAVGLALAHKPLLGWAASLLGRDDATASSDTSS
ncbi:hypothetical protein ASE86_08435 [Sphingomonas sp. Leaf33]|uniref:hypothetical protein n=1 Tax=Sphingomonas sp. Leaf33 TaxID=1736215 RepID=UPI0006F86A07|nr:hypothetical protein [Sphingomonas sp. Leaf33]KQN26168.1 hypothetical protein ASE86_08435 [Sphingomonas sp. Leaf33]